MLDSDLDSAVRLHLYERFVATGSPPTVAETARMLGRRHDEVAAAYGRLEEARAIVLAPGTLNVWMAQPLSAVATPFRVETERGAFWGNCIWDALGVIAMLGGDGRVATQCPECADPLDFRVERGELVPADGIVHFAVPAARWWDNIGFT